MSGIRPRLVHQNFPAKNLSGNRLLPFLRNWVSRSFSYSANSSTRAKQAFTLLYVFAMGTFTPKGLSLILLPGALEDYFLQQNRLIF